MLCSNAILSIMAFRPRMECFYPNGREMKIHLFRNRRVSVPLVKCGALMKVRAASLCTTYCHCHLWSEWGGGRDGDRECEWRKTRQLCVACYAQLKEPNQAANQMSGSGLLGESAIICMAFSGKETWQLAAPQHAVRLPILHRTCLLTAFKLLLWNL